MAQQKATNVSCIVGCQFAGRNAQIFRDGTQQFHAIGFCCFRRGFFSSDLHAIEFLPKALSISAFPCT